MKKGQTRAAIEALLAAVQAEPAVYATIAERCGAVRVLLTDSAGNISPDKCTTAELCALMEKIRRPGPFWFYESGLQAAKVLKAAIAGRAGSE